MKALMVKTLFLSALLLTSGLSYGCNVKGLIEKAEQTRQQAAKAGYEWTATAGLIKDAKAALKKGELKLAVKLTNKAQKQGDNALLQAKFADEHWQDFEPK